MSLKYFREAVMEKFGCPAEAYAETVFWHCLYPHAVSAAKIIRRFNRGFFADDFELIGLVAQLTSPADLHKEIEIFRYYHGPQGLLRHKWRVRISCQKLSELGEELLR